MSITEERLAQIAARLAAATPGPWSVVQGNLNTYVTSHDEMLQARIQGLHPHDGRETNAVADADFLAHARADCRDLLAELRATREQRDRAVGSAKAWCETADHFKNNALAAEAREAALRAALEQIDRGTQIVTRDMEGTRLGALGNIARAALAAIEAQP